jgi:hypothetical protein
MTSTVDTAPGPARDECTPERTRPGPRTDLVVALGYLGLAVFVLAHLWWDPSRRILKANPWAQAYAERLLAHGSDVLTKLASPLFQAGTARGGMGPTAPAGYLGISLPMAPMTWAFGPAVSYPVAATLCLAGTGFAWYYLLSRHLVRSRLAAVLGGLVGGFGPAMVAHVEGDLSRTALFLVPFLIWRTYRLIGTSHRVRDGLLLGALIVWQMFIDPELLLLLAVAGLVFLLVWRLSGRRAAVDPPALGIAVLTGLVLGGYPFWRLFGAAGHGELPVRGSDGTDLFAFVAQGLGTLGGWPQTALAYAPIFSEQNTFYGWPAMVLLVAAGWVVRTPVMRGLAVTGLVFAVFSLGAEITLKGVDTGIPGPWKLFTYVPVAKRIPPADLAILLLPMAAFMIALMVDSVASRLAGESTDPGTVRKTRLAWYALLAGALLPLLPLPLAAIGAPEYGKQAGTVPRPVVVSASGTVHLLPGLPDDRELV